jgi:hypothetical protein
VAARERDLQRPPRLQLTSNLGQIRLGAPVHGSLARRRVARDSAVRLEAQRVRQLDAWRRRPRPPMPVRAHEHRRLGQSCGRHHLDPVCQRRLGGTVCRHDHALHSSPRQSSDHGQQAWDRPQIAAER